MNASRSVSLPQLELVGEETPGWDLRLLLPTLALVAIGVAMVFSAAIPISAREGTSVYVYLHKEAVFLTLAVAAMVCAARLSLPRLYDRAFLFLLIALVLLAGVHVVGKEVNGAKSWYDLKLLSFQPSELAKLVLVIAMARYFTKFPGGLRSFRQMLPPLVMMGAVCLLILKEPDMGTVAVIGLSMLIYFHIAGAKARHLAVIALLALALVSVKIAQEPYQLERLKNFFFPPPGAEMDGNYQIDRSLIALGSGGLLGRGYTSGVEKYFYLPEATTDAILAVIGEELGLVATWTVLALLAYLVVQGLRIAGMTEDRFAGLVAAGITCLFGVQALMNIAVVTGVVPTTGITLPFVSYGGSSLLLSMAEVGLLLNVARTPRRARARQAAA